MAPKKKGGKKEGKKGGGDADGELSPQELLRRAAFRIESLERQLAWREEKVAAALAGQRDLKEKVSLYHEDFEREKASIFDIASDMTRQYKGMQAAWLADAVLWTEPLPDRLCHTQCRRTCRGAFPR